MDVVVGSGNKNGVTPRKPNEVLLEIDIDQAMGQGKMRPSLFGTLIHELMHIAVLNSPAVRERVMEFINKHRKKIVKHPVKGYYYELDIPMPSKYCTYFSRRRKNAFPEEFVSMFFTCLLTDTTQRDDMDDVIRTATEFAEKYPEYYNAVMKILGVNKK